MVTKEETDQQWEGLLLEPREEVNLEIKSWLDLSDNDDAANLAKAMLALANSGGGQILIGYEEADESWQPDPDRPASIDGYDQDTINGIVEKFADPQFHCNVYHVKHPESDEVFPVVDVPGGHRVPIRADSAGPDNNHVKYNRYYIRRPGPESSPPKTAREWDELIRRCVVAAKDDLVDSMRSVITGFEADPAQEDQDPLDNLVEWTDTMHADWQEIVEESEGSIANSLYRDGYWLFAYRVIGEFEEPALPDLKELMREVKGHETGWPVWMVNENYVYPLDELIEAWFVDTQFDDPSHADFWRADPNGSLFLLRGYREDSQDDQEPGEILDYVLPIWQVGECLLHARRLAHELCGDDASVAVDIRWAGLSGRSLSAITQRRGLFPPVNHECRQDEVTVQHVFTLSELEDNLPEVVETLNQPLYQAFDFFEQSPQLIQNELDRLQQ